MPARDIYHDCVRNALVKDGWTITHDPYRIPVGIDKVYVDLGAERTLAAERGGERIAVEIKSFLGPSDLHDFEMALGQFMLYRTLMNQTEPDRKLFLAVPRSTFDTTFRRPIVEIPVEELKVSCLVFDPEREEVLRWTT